MVNGVIVAVLGTVITFTQVLMLFCALRFPRADHAARNERDAKGSDRGRLRNELDRFHSLKHGWPGVSGHYGKVDPWTLSTLHEDLNGGIKQALGPDATDAEVAIAQAAAVSEQDSYLKSIGAHPDQPCILRLPGLGCVDSPEFLAKLEKIVYGVIALGALAGAFFLWQRYGSTLKKTFAKR